MIKQNYSISKEQDEELRAYCKDTGLKMSTVVQISLNMYFAAAKFKKKKNETDKKNRTKKNN